ncbi:pirin [Spirosoma agri]|uniref:Pirin n=2 Tax=Spirosoma agri TaxID=1987381 RepID=A0A6M0IEW1_9BACT|nr:pirin [Spirosoma agri]
MDTQTQAQIYLADQRGCSETPFFRSYHTFNFGPYTAEDREPFGPLHLLNDDTLRVGASLTMRVEQPTTVVLFPVMGGLEYTVDGSIDFLEPGQLGVLAVPTGTTYSVSNPYEQEQINFLQLWLTNPSDDLQLTIDQIPFDLTTINTLLPIFGSTNLDHSDHPTVKGFIGRYTGRQEGTYPIAPAAELVDTGMFVFVLQGAFEVANRLLHAKDSLSLRYNQPDQLEFEALSNDAIILLLELPFR